MCEMYSYFIQPVAILSEICCTVHRWYKGKLWYLICCIDVLEEMGLCVLVTCILCAVYCNVCIDVVTLDVSVRKVLRPATSIQVFFLGFPVSLKQMLRWFPRFQVATTCFSCSPPDVNLVAKQFQVLVYVL